MQSSFPEKPFVLRTPHAHLAAVLHTAASKRLTILCHGFTGNKTESGCLFVQTARALQKAGLNALRFDFMGSGDSSGEFNQMTPNTQIRDARAVLAWALRRYQKVAFLGLSFGGATAICAAQQESKPPDALLTWLSVPDLAWWSETLVPRPNKPNPHAPGNRFWTDLPKVNVPEAYAALKIPRLQIQGDHDIPEFRERFARFAHHDDPQVWHLIVPGADHVFTNWEHRRKVISESVRWLKKQLA